MDSSPQDKVPLGNLESFQSCTYMHSFCERLRGFDIAMKKELTLHLDEKVLKGAETYAEKRGVSVATLIEQYIQTLHEAKPENEDVELGPITQALGVDANEDLTEEDYREHLWQKYGAS